MLFLMGNGKIQREKKNGWIMEKKKKVQKREKGLVDSGSVVEEDDCGTLKKGGKEAWFVMEETQKEREKQ